MMRSQSEAKHSVEDLSARSPRRRRGITLLEILVVVGLIGILAAIIAPNMTRVIRRAQLEGAAHTLLQRLNEARAEAIVRGVDVIVHPDVRGDRHFLVAWADVNDDAVFGQEPNLATPGAIDVDGNYVASPDVPEKSTDYVLYEHMLSYKPGSQVSSVYFWGQAEDEPSLGTVTCGAEDCGAVDDLKLDGLELAGARIEANGYGDWERALVFEPEGSVPVTGSLRLGMGAWGAGNAPKNFLELRVATQAGGRIELRKFVPSANRYVARDEGYPWKWF